MIHEIEVVEGDITEMQVDAIVNAANRSLLGGGGVDGAIHRKAGKKLYEECVDLRAHEYKEGMPVGEACVTKAYDLKAQFVIHTVGPVFSEKEDRSKLLENAFKNSLDKAEELHLTTIAFPAISTGAYRWPVKDCARIAKKVIEKYHAKYLYRVIVCLNDKKKYRIFKEVFEK